MQKAMVSASHLNSDSLDYAKTEKFLIEEVELKLARPMIKMAKMVVPLTYPFLFCWD